MAVFQFVKRFLNPARVVIGASFLLWVFIFRGFLFNERVLQSDALAYYEHFEYFIKNISRGVYPLWEPTLMNGMPTEFFLRRIGSFNPFYLLMALVHKCGVPFLYTYLWFLAGYYFLGAIGFYCLAKRVLCEEKSALLAFLLLFFSSLGTRIFDSYFILTFVPLIWFFYFAVAFFQQPARGYWLGAVFTVMLILTTYLPFYFLLIVLSFIFFYSVFYFRHLSAHFGVFWKFILKNRLLAALSAVVLLLSLAPGVLFYLDGKQGELILPMRGGVSAEEGHIMQVSQEMVDSWGIIEDVLFSFHFQDVRLMKFAVLYVPVVAWIVLFLGAFVRVSRRLVFLGIWMMGFYLVIATYGPFHQFFYDHIFFFKYFRNIHFFLWLILLPLFVLFVSELFGLFLEQTRKQGVISRFGLGLVVLVHVVFFIWGLKVNPTGWLSMVAIVLSCVFWIRNLTIERGRAVHPKLLFVLFLMVGIQSAEAYSYLAQNSPKTQKPFPYRYENKTPYFQFPMIHDEDRRSFLSAMENLKAAEKTVQPADAYITMVWNKYLREQLSPSIFDYYAAMGFIAYDDIKVIDKKNFEFDEFLPTFTRLKNQAFVFVEQGKDVGFDTPNHPSGEADIITLESGKIKPGKYTVNEMGMETNFETKKFLVLTENFHNSWRAFIDGNPVPLWQTNVAFRGVVVPEGRHALVFKFGEPWRIFLNGLLIVVFNAIFLFLVLSLIRDRSAQKAEVSW